MRFADSEILLKRGANQFDTLSNIDRIASREAKHEFIQESIKKYNLRPDLNSLKKIFEAGFRIIFFFPDPYDIQNIRTVNRSLKDRRGNCVDYTVFFSAFLRALGIPHIIRMVSFDPSDPGNYSHIYPMTLDGVILDAVFGQDQNGNEVNRKNRRPLFNRTIPHVGKFDKIIR